MFFSLFVSTVYSNLYLGCYKKYNNSFELKKNVILGTFDLRFLEKYIQFDYWQQETCSETFFRTVIFEKIKIESNFKYYVSRVNVRGL